VLLLRDFEQRLHDCFPLVVHRRVDEILRRRCHQVQRLHDLDPFQEKGLQPSEGDWESVPLQTTLQRSVVQRTVQHGINPQPHLQVTSYVGVEVRDYVGVEIRAYVRVEIRAYVCVEVRAYVCVEVRAYVGVEVRAYIGVEVGVEVRVAVRVAVRVEVRDWKLELNLGLKLGLKLELKL